MSTNSTDHGNDSANGTLDAFLSLVPDDAFIAAADKVVADPSFLNKAFRDRLAPTNNPRKLSTETNGPHRVVLGNGHPAQFKLIAYPEFNGGDRPALLTAYGTALPRSGAPQNNMFDGLQLGRLRSAIPVRALRDTDTYPGGTPISADVVQASMYAIGSIERIYDKYNRQLTAAGPAPDKINGTFAIPNPSDPEEWLAVFLTQQLYNTKAVVGSTNKMSSGDDDIMMTPAQRRRTLVKHLTDAAHIDTPLFVEDAIDPLGYFKNSVDHLKAPKCIFATYPNYRDARGRPILPHDYAEKLDVGLPLVISGQIEVWIISNTKGTSRSWHLLADDIAVLRPDDEYMHALPTMTAAPSPAATLADPSSPHHTPSENVAGPSTSHHAPPPPSGGSPSKRKVDVDATPASAPSSPKKKKGSRTKAHHEEADEKDEHDADRMVVDKYYSVLHRLVNRHHSRPLDTPCAFPHDTNMSNPNNIHNTSVAHAQLIEDIAADLLDAAATGVLDSFTKLHIVFAGKVNVTISVCRRYLYPCPLSSVTPSIVDDSTSRSLKLFLIRALIFWSNKAQRGDATPSAYGNCAERGLEKLNFVTCTLRNYPSLRVGDQAPRAATDLVTWGSLPTVHEMSTLQTTRTKSTLPTTRALSTLSTTSTISFLSATREGGGVREVVGGVKEVVGGVVEVGEGFVEVAEGVGEGRGGVAEITEGVGEGGGNVGEGGEDVGEGGEVAGDVGEGIGDVVEGVGAVVGCLAKVVGSVARVRKAIGEVEEGGWGRSKGLVSVF
ncbi:hypothetical protein GGG16DRAFT_106619, partial [Schizophyllum commune]